MHYSVFVGDMNFLWNSFDKYNKVLKFVVLYTYNKLLCIILFLIFDKYSILKKM